MNSHLETSIPRTLLWIGLLFTGYLLTPLFSSVHIEGFSAQIESIAYLKSVDSTLNHDPFMSLVTQFIYQTRGLVIWLLAGIFAIFGNIGLHAFQLLTGLSFALLLYSSIKFARLWLEPKQVHWLYGLFAMALTPGIFELSFYFNDNIVSAALAVTALTLIAVRLNNLHIVLSALFFTLATLSRIDAIFIGPIILGLMIFHAPSFRLFAQHSVLYAASVLFIYVISYQLLGFTLLDAYLVAQHFILDISFLKNLVLTKLYFLGIIIVPPLLIGLFSFSKFFLKSKQTILLLSLIIYPVLLFLFAPKATETRYIFPLLTPIIALIGGYGLHQITQWTLNRDKTLWTKLGSYAYWIFLIGVMTIPPVQTQFKDGPRSINGRLWSPIIWQDWQNSVNQNMQTLDKMVNQLSQSASPSIIITLHYNDEYFLRMKLIEAGFTPSKENTQACQGISFFTKGNQRVYHLRTRPSYGIAPISAENLTALQLQQAEKCINLNQIELAYLTDYTRGGYPIRNKLLGNFGFHPIYQHNLPTFLRQSLPSYGTIVSLNLTDEHLKNALSNAHKALENQPSTKRFTMQAFLEYYKPQVALFKRDNKDAQ